MPSTQKSVRAAVVQAAPVIMNREATVEKTLTLIKEAASKGARIIVFPEAFISAYPRGLTFGAVIGSRPMESREDWLRYYESSIAVPG